MQEYAVLQGLSYLALACGVWLRATARTVHLAIAHRAADLLAGATTPIPSA